MLRSHADRVARFIWMEKQFFEFYFQKKIGSFSFIKNYSISKIGMNFNDFSSEIA